MTPQARAQSDEALLRRFLALDALARARRVLLFYGMGEEPETGRLLPLLTAQGKELCLPRCRSGGVLELRCYLGESSLTRHHFGMLEPSEDCPLVDAAWPELALIPAVCYDAQGWRLGRGGGFYDRFLARYSGQTVGLCREALLQDQVPREEHDRAVGLVLTERRTLTGVAGWRRAD